MQKISWGIKSLLEKTHAQYIITTIIHLFEINKEDGLLSLAYLLKASFIFPLSSCLQDRQRHCSPRENPRATLWCLCSAFAFQHRKVPNLGTNAQCVLKWDPVGCSGGRSAERPAAAASAFPCSLSPAVFLWARLLAPYCHGRDHEQSVLSLAVW